MALAKYKEKRNFKESPEPVGGKPDSDRLRFVIQKHAASHLHYDFRLEIEGVLKSWAVPKGPSTDPAVKRLAMMVEDHPYDYRNFEGIIPSGYGAGTVIVWDEGFYEDPELESDDKKLHDKGLRKQLYSGKLKIRLHGKKLKGEYVLVKAHGRGENGWLLFKVEDKYASAADITLKDKSVLSGKTLEQVEKSSTNFYGAQKGRQTPVKKAAVPKKTAVTKKSPATPKEIPAKSVTKKPGKAKSEKPPDIGQKGTGARFPSKIIPMLATLVDKPFHKDDWQYEIKWDGYRTLAFCNKGKAELKSRNDKSFNEKFYPVYEAIKELGLNIVLDGEIVVLDEKGRADFGALQNWRSEADAELFFYVFDVLWYEGRSMMQLPLHERQAILKQLLRPNEIIRISESFEEDGLAFFEAAKKMGLEGIMAKQRESTYAPGLRSKEWLKIKANKRQEMVIGGFTKNDDTSRAFSSLLVGVFKKDKLIYAGKVGTGFNQQQQKEMLKLFQPLIIQKPPFDEMPDINKASRFRPNPPNATAVWMKPELICEVSFTEMTTDGIMRHPSFEGMRSDKKAQEVTREESVDTKKIIAAAKKSPGLLSPPLKGQRKTLLNPTDETQVRKVNTHELKFTNLSKLYWPEDGVTKRDMLNYYYKVAPYILPYLKDRPQSLNRYPDGIHGKSFYQKDITGKAPAWVKTHLYHSEAEPEDKHFLVGSNEASLLYMASLGCIEMNPWSSRIEKPDHPDFCIIDLDPAENTFNQVIEAAQVTNQILTSMNVSCYVKTSGSTGIHIYIPLGAKYTYDTSKEFARIIATMVQRELPKYTSIERIIKKRKGKMYIDFLQNRPHATVAAAYSLRPKPGATVSMPLHWDEVKKGLKMKDFNIHNAIERIASEGDIFKPVLGKAVNLEKVIKEFNKNK